jgi:hypothetical protein
MRCAGVRFSIGNSAPDCRQISSVGKQVECGLPLCRGRGHSQTSAALVATPLGFDRAIGSGAFRSLWRCQACNRTSTR